MNRRLGVSTALAGLMVIAICVASRNVAVAAGGVIQGTVKATGLASNADAVVYVQQAPGTFPAPAKPANIDQRSMQFSPHVLPILVGTTVQFLNSDPTPHNVFSPDHEKFNLGTWPQGQTKDHPFTTCAKAPCSYVLLCRVHPEMEGYVVVLQNPFFAATGADGHYRIDNVPPGSYAVGVWHPKLKSPAVSRITVDAAKPAVVDFTLNR
jgi:plastocyanin